jgi:hypothetical protein
MAWNAIGFAAPCGRERRSSLLIGGPPPLRASRAFTPRFAPANLPRAVRSTAFQVTENRSRSPRIEAQAGYFASAPPSVGNGTPASTAGPQASSKY